MNELILEEIVHVPKAKAWEVIVNQFGHVHEWNPNLQGSHFMTVNAIVIWTIRRTSKKELWI